MKHQIIQSRFRGVYLGTFLLWVTANMSLHLLINTIIEPAFQLTRVQAVESLIRSHDQDLLYDNHRALRDELLRQKILADDRDFEELHPGRSEDKLILKKDFASCDEITKSSCLGPSHAIFFGGMGSESDKLAGFAVVMKTDYFKKFPELILLRIFGSLGFGVLLGIVAWGIRQQEKFLLGKIGLLTSSLSKVEELFRAEGISSHLTPLSSAQAGSAAVAASKINDEFTLASESLNTAGNLLQEKTRQIEIYKREFEKKTRLEQLAQTISYTSHELKAPLEEGARFLADLPDFLATMPKEKLYASIRSLEERLRQCAESFQKALNETRDANLYPEPIASGAFLEYFRKIIQAQPHLKSQMLQLTLDPAVSESKILIRRAEMESALWNLLRNSLDAKHDCQIEITAEKQSEMLVIHYRDNGPGIPDLLLDRIFEEYFTTKTHGSGVGLSIVKQAIERSRGSIRAVSSNTGAHFEISIPILDSTVAEGEHIPHA